MRKDVREFIRRLEAAGLTVESTPGHYHVYRDGKPLRKANGMPISRRVQAAKGDVTEAADEAVVGIEMVQAFGREDDVRERFGAKAASVRNIVVQQAGVEAKHLPALFYLPTLSIAAVVFFGGRDVIDGNLTIGQFVLFNTILLQLT